MYIGQAIKSLQENKLKYFADARNPRPLLRSEEEYLLAYAQVMLFLSNTNRGGGFVKALESVSRQVWVEYRGLASDTRDRFSRALGIVARRKCFAFAPHLPYTPTDKPLPPALGIELVGNDRQLGYMLRAKYFWRDSLTGRHGEHSHSLQWLAIAEGARAVLPAHELYSRASEFRMMRSDDTHGERNMFLWGWMCDCFPSDMSSIGSLTVLKDGSNLVADNFRSPQYIMDHLLLGDPAPKRTHFLSSYLYSRYRKRDWLETAWDAEAGEGGAMVVKGLGNRAINTPARAEPEWIKSPSSPDARLVRKQHPAAGTAKKTVVAKFHGIEGNVNVGKGFVE